ncbi:MAG: cytochrome b, partial [Wolbachia sp.]
LFKKFFWIFVVNFVFLTWLGGEEAKEPYITLSRLSTLYYFTYFVIVLPLLSKYEKPENPPKTISDSVPEMK